MNTKGESMSDADTEGVWVETNSEEHKRLPKWMRRSALYPDGTVFLPAGVWMSETAALMCASHDGRTQMVVDGEHVYLPAEWLASEFPAHAEDILAIADIVRDADPSAKK